MASDGSQADHKPPAPPEQPPLPEQGLHCPRCDSSNTKFCYYNNYSLTQPRHFCKTCRRYWTRGGALRNVPIGGGCRKNKKAKTDSSLSGSGGADKDPSSGGMRFLHGFSSSMDHHQLGGLPFSRLHLSTTGSFNQFFPFGDLSSPAVGAASPNTPATCSSAFDSSAISSSLEGLKHPFSKVTRQEESGVHVGGSQDMGPANIHTNIATSIETLSFINQDLHWKLQQQRLAMLFGGNHREISAVAEGSAPGCESQKNHGPYISLQTMGSSTAGDCGENPDKGCLVHNSNELFYGNSFALANSSNSGNKSSSWNGVESWNDLHQNSALR